MIFYERGQLWLHVAGLILNAGNRSAERLVETAITALPWGLIRLGEHNTQTHIQCYSQQALKYKWHRLGLFTDLHGIQWKWIGCVFSAQNIVEESLYLVDRKFRSLFQGLMNCIHTHIHTHLRSTSPWEPLHGQKKRKNAEREWVWRDMNRKMSVRKT